MVEIRDGFYIACENSRVRIVFTYWKTDRKRTLHWTVVPSPFTLSNNLRKKCLQLGNCGPSNLFHVLDIFMLEVKTLLFFNYLSSSLEHYVQ